MAIATGKGAKFCCRALLRRSLHASATASTSGGGGAEKMAAALASGGAKQPEAHIYNRLSHRVLRLATGEGGEPKKVALFQLGLTLSGGAEAAQGSPMNSGLTQGCVGEITLSGTLGTRASSSMSLATTIAELSSVL